MQSVTFQTVTCVTFGLVTHVTLWPETRRNPPFIRMSRFAVSGVAVGRRVTRQRSQVNVCGCH
jgi:hypothetical protein